VGQKHFFYAYTVKRESKTHHLFIPCLFSKHTQEERTILEQYLKEKKHGKTERFTIRKTGAHTAAP